MRQWRPVSGRHLAGSSGHLPARRQARCSRHLFGRARFVGALGRQSHSVTIAGHGRRARSADRRGYCLPETRQLRHADQVDLALLVALKTCAHSAAGLSRQAARASCVRRRGFWLRPARRADARTRTSLVSAGRAGRRSPRGLGHETRLPTWPRFHAALAGCNQQPVTVGGDLHVGQGVAVATAAEGHSQQRTIGYPAKPRQHPRHRNDHVRRPVGGEGDHLASEHIRGPQPAFMPARELQERKHPRTDPGPH